MRKPHPKTGFIPVERPAGALDFEDFAQAHYALERALENGDYSPLLARARAGKALPAEQKLLADIYEKRLKRPSHRLRQSPEALRFRRLYLALYVLDHRLKTGSKRKAAIANAATANRVSESTVKAAIKQHRDLFVRCGFLHRRR